MHYAEGTDFWEDERISGRRITFPAGGAAIEDEFAEGKECCLLYEGVYQAGRNLCERLGEDEDSDVETILNGMERIFRPLSMKMYEYDGQERGDVV